MDYGPHYCEDEKVPKLGRHFKGTIPSTGVTQICENEEMPKFGRDFKGTIPSIIVIEIGT